MARPNIIFGGATIGMGIDDVETVSSALHLLQKGGVSYIDTAGRYPPVNPGRSETLLGEAGAAARGFTIDTKILASAGDGSGELEEGAIKKSVTTSLQRLHVSSVQTLSF